MRKACSGRVLTNQIRSVKREPCAYDPVTGAALVLPPTRPGTDGRPVFCADWEREGKTTEKDENGKAVKGGFRLVGPDGVERPALVSKRAALQGGLWVPGSDLLLERPHLVPQNGRSRAQVFTRDELEELVACARNDEVRIFELSQYLTPRAREEGGHAIAAPAGETPQERQKRKKKEKENDPQAHRALILANPQIALPLFRLSTEKSAADALRRKALAADMDRRLNVMRAQVPKYLKHPEVDDAQALLYEIYEALSEEARSICGLEFYKTPATKRHLFKDSALRWTLVMTVYTYVFDEQGRIRLNPDGKFVGISEMKNVLKTSPFHGGAGVGHSNLYYWVLKAIDPTPFGYKNLTVEQAKKRKEIRRQLNRVLVELAQKFRDIGWEREKENPRPAVEPAVPGTLEALIVSVNALLPPEQAELLLAHAGVPS